MRAPSFLVLALLLIACSPDGAASSATAGSGGGSPSTSASTGGGASSWRSALFPEDWTPAFTDDQGRFLHDVSYAGYHLGEADPGGLTPPLTLDVSTYGADATGTTDATAAVQHAIDDLAVMGGGVVAFPAGTFRLDGLVTVTSSFTVLRGAGADATKLFFTKVAGMTDAAHVTFSGDGASDVEVALANDGASRATFVEVADAAGLAVGDDVSIGWVISPEFVEEHGMTGTWTAFNGTWQPFFRRTIAAIDATTTPARIALDVPLRYVAKTRDLASVRRQSGFLREVGVEALGLSNAVAWDDAWTVHQSHVLRFVHVQDGWITGVKSFPSPIAPASGPGAADHLQSGGFLIEESKRFTIADASLGHAENRGSGGDGYLFEIQRSSEVLVRDSQGDAGRHNFIQNWGFGTTGCVFLRVTSKNGVAMVDENDTLNLAGLSEMHHSLAMANLFDASTFDDGVSIVNRLSESTGAGHTGTENVFWNVRGAGALRSLQFGIGYVIGTSGLFVTTSSPLLGIGAEPDDYTEGLDRADGLDPPSLFEAQRKKRLGK